MRAGIVRSDLGNGVYVSDIDSRSQYPYASVVHGQSRTLRKPTDDELSALVKANPLPVAITGLNTGTAVDSRLATGLSIKASRGGTFSTIPVGGTGAALKTTIAAQLNSGFASAGLPLSASVVGTNQLRVSTTRLGPDAYVEINSQGSAGFTGALNYVLGIAPGVFAAPSSKALLTALKASVYTGQRFDVGSGAISAAGVTVNTGAAVNYGLLGTGGFSGFQQKVADLVAPKLVDGGDVQLSFAKGVMSKVRSPGFVFNGVTGPGLYATLDDGVTPYTYP
jgi:hypothetical protein